MERIREGSGLRRLGRAGPERALDHRRVRPVAELVADRGQIADLAEAERLVQSERGAVGRVDIADHLPEARRRAGVDQRAHQPAADAAMEMVVVDVDRVLDAKAIGGALAERHGVGVADHDAVLLRHDVGHLAPLHRLAPALEVLGVGRLELAVDARIDAPANVMQVDREHRRDVGVARIAHENPPRSRSPPLLRRLRGSICRPSSARITP